MKTNNLFKTANLLTIDKVSEKKRNIGNFK